MSLILNSGFTVGPGVILDANPAPPTITPVAAGLRLHLDAGNTSSYPGSGTTWTDLVDGKQFTLYNGPTYYSSNGGYLNFDPGSGQYANATSFPATLPNWSVEAWHYYTGNNTGYNPCIITEAYAGTYINFTLGTIGGTLAVGHWDGGSFSQTPAASLITGHWYHLVGTYDGHTHNLYINGELAATGAASLTCISGGAGIVLMNRWDPGSTEYWGGRLAIVRIYDTTLDLAGVTQNYTADRTRFGL